MLNEHTGTHVDAPAHFLPPGHPHHLWVDQVPIDRWVGPACLVSCDDAEWITEVKKLKVRGDPKQWRPGKFVHPHDACFDRDGNIFVVEWVQTGRVTLLRRVG